MLELWSLQNQEAAEKRSKKIEAEREKSPERQKTRRQDVLDAKRKKYVKE